MDERQRFRYANNPSERMVSSSVPTGFQRTVASGVVTPTTPTSVAVTAPAEPVQFPVSVPVAEPTMAAAKLELHEKPITHGPSGRSALVRGLLYAGAATAIFAGGIGISYVTTRKVAAPPDAAVSPQPPGQATSGSANEIRIAAGSGLSAELQPSSTSTGTTAANGYSRTQEEYQGSTMVLARQPLPDSYTTDPQALQKVAQELKATPQFTSNKWGVVYILSDASTHVQVAIMHNASELFIVQSSKVIANSAWQTFVDSH